MGFGGNYKGEDVNYFLNLIMENNDKLSYFDAMEALGRPRRKHKAFAISLINKDIRQDTNNLLISRWSIPERLPPVNRYHLHLQKTLKELYLNRILAKD